MVMMVANVGGGRHGHRCPRRVIVLLHLGDHLTEGVAVRIGSSGRPIRWVRRVSRARARHCRLRDIRTSGTASSSRPRVVLATDVGVGVVGAVVLENAGTACLQWRRQCAGCGHQAGGCGSGWCCCWHSARRLFAIRIVVGIGRMSRMNKIEVIRVARVHRIAIVGGDVAIVASVVDTRRHCAVVVECRPIGHHRREGGQCRWYRNLKAQVLIECGQGGGCGRRRRRC